jgi:hypothetical protein
MPESKSGSFAAMVGHELNNIAVPLEGYAEQAADNAAATESAKNGLEEMRTAIARIRSIASDLENLAEPASPPITVAIGDCMPDDLADIAAGAPVIDWRCSASTAISVDRPHAERAIRSLGMLSARTRAQLKSVPTWEVFTGSAAPARCASCAAAARRKDHCVLVRTHTDRPVTADALNDPFGPARAGKLSRRLTLAVLVYSAHCANGHVYLDDDTGLVSLAFPVA